MSAAHAGHRHATPGCDYLADPEVADRHPDRHRGRLRPRRATAAWTPNRPTSGATSRRCAAIRAASVRTAPARLVAGLAARRAADAGPLAVVSCDNLPDNGAVAARVVERLRRRCSTPTLADWIDDNVSFVTTMVDRITPATTPDDVDAVAELTGRADAAPVVTEPFTEWVLAGEFPGGRPAWDDAGARFVDDIAPFEERKLWLLNGGHSLLAYAGSARGHQTIAEAVTDPVCRDWMEQWWTEASRPPDPARAGRRGLPGRAAGAVRQPADPAPAGADRRRRIAEAADPDPADRPAERAQGRLPVGALRVLAAWVNHLRGAGAPVKDAAAEQVVALARRSAR